jgi:hypothetical protein
VEPAVWHKVFVNVYPAGSDMAIDESVQAGVTREVASTIRLRWVTKVPPETGDHLFVTLPELPPTGQRLRVAVTDRCGNLCGHGMRYLVVNRGTTWTARQVGPSTIS